jgi:hypothetical protein
MKKAVLFIGALILLSLITNAKDNGKGYNFLNKPAKAAGSGTCFDENTHLINVGIGIGGVRYYGFSRGGGYSYSSSPAISISYEQPWSKRVGPGFLGVGGYLGFKSARARYEYNYWNGNNNNTNYYYEHRWNHIVLAARAVYHWDVLNWEKGEVYGGALVGVRIRTYDYATNDNTPGVNYRRSDAGVSPLVAAFAGARWYFAPKFALFAEAEAGYSISFINGGITFKF